MILLEESEEGSLSTGGTLDTSESDIVASTLDVSEIPEKFLYDIEGSVILSLLEASGRLT